MKMEEVITIHPQSLINYDEEVFLEVLGNRILCFQPHDMTIFLECMGYTSDFFKKGEEYIGLFSKDIDNSSIIINFKRRPFFFGEILTAVYMFDRNIEIHYRNNIEVFDIWPLIEKYPNRVDIETFEERLEKLMKKRKEEIMKSYG